MYRVLCGLLTESIEYLMTQSAALLDIFNALGLLESLIETIILYLSRIDQLLC